VDGGRLLKSEKQGGRKWARGLGEEKDMANIR